MSTPTTAVATLPPSNYYAHHSPHHQYAHPHSNHRSGVSANYRYVPNHNSPSSATITTATAPSASSGASTNPQPLSVVPNHGGAPVAPHLQSALGGYPLTVDGVNQQPSGPRPPPHASYRNSDYTYSTAGVAVGSSRNQPAQFNGYGAPEMADPPTKKRRRSQGPDWDTFYQNGLPKEVIVIPDDTPEPEQNNSRKLANTTSTRINANIDVTSSHSSGAANTSAVRQPAKKRRKEDEVDKTQSQKYRLQHPSSHGNTPAGASISSDGTTSALNTTAATSLSSNGYLDDLSLPQKRKRTRQQVANEAKRRDTDVLGSRMLTYKPPALPVKKAPDVRVRAVPDTRLKGTKVDDDDGHYIIVPEAPLTDRYYIKRLLGQGTFGKVVLAHDISRKKDVAIKIIRSVQKYRDASKIELRVLATLKANDDENRNRCIHLRDCFDFCGHICIVMDLLSQSVFDFLKGNGFVPFPNSQIQSFARQLFTSVAFLHDLNLIHTDLKPENILLCDAQYQTFTYNRRIPSSSTNINRTAAQRRVLLDTEIRLIDFGSATFQDEYHSSVVSTRHYRAPEIILGLGWSYPCDIWSIGCILVEFYTGDALFQTHDNLEHLAMMEAVVGRKIDSHLVQQVNKGSSRHGANSAARYFKRLKLDYPNAETTRGSRRFVKAMRNLDDVIPTTTPFMRNFKDLLRKIFVYDPSQRITAHQALQHEWFKEMAHSDDGTEAARLRVQRLTSRAQRLNEGRYAEQQTW